MKKALCSPLKKRSVSALALKNRLYRHRIVKSKKIYSRKKKELDND